MNTPNPTSKKYQYLNREPEIICLIGSSRFKQLHFKVMRDETLKGNIVLPMGMFGHDEGLDMDGPIKKMLDELHLVKIDKSSIVIVCNDLVPFCRKCNEHRMKEMGCSCESAWELWVKPYIGESTRREINYAYEQKKEIRFVHHPDMVRHCDDFTVVNGVWVLKETKELPTPTFSIKGTDTGRWQSNKPNK